VLRVVRVGEAEQDGGIEEIGQGRSLVSQSS
jgi:hypothetical protein